MKICVVDADGYACFELVYPCTFSEFQATLESSVLECDPFDPEEDDDYSRAYELEVADLIVQFNQTMQARSEPEYRVNLFGLTCSILGFCFGDPAFLEQLPEAEQLNLDGMIQIPRSPRDRVRCGFRQTTLDSGQRHDQEAAQTACPED